MKVETIKKRLPTFAHELLRHVLGAFGHCIVMDEIVAWPSASITIRDIYDGKEVKFTLTVSDPNESEKDTP